MESFITQSETSKQILKSITLSTNLPVNTLIYGQVGVGKKTLASTVLPNTSTFCAKKLESYINSKTINLEEYNSLILHDIDQVLNMDEFLDNLKGIKLIATSLHNYPKFQEQFAIKLEIPPLKDREEDLKELTKRYIHEARIIYGSNINEKSLNIDLSQNAITLKRSIYKSIMLQSISKTDVMQNIQIFIEKELQNGKTYKELLELFEVPLLKAAKNIFKSQLKMAQNLSINRITLRKKIHQYFKDEI